MSRSSIVLAAILTFAVFNTLLAMFQLLSTLKEDAVLRDLSASISPSAIGASIRPFQERALPLAAASWSLAAIWTSWRGIRSRWVRLGFDDALFELFVKMKGRKTRIRLLLKLAVAKNRLQLARELCLDWKAIDQHVRILRKYGLVQEAAAWGKVRSYQLTPLGKLLLQVLSELDLPEEISHVRPEKEDMALEGVTLADRPRREIEPKLVYRGA